LLGRTAPAAVAAGCLDWSPELLRKEQEKDPNISEALSWVENNQRPAWRQMQAKSPMLRALWRQFQSLVLRDGVLHRIFHDTAGSADFYQVVLPRPLRSPLLDLIHSDVAGHLKYEKCLDHIKRRCWWYEYKTDLKVFVANCSKCSAFHRGQPPRQAFLNPMPLGQPAQRWTIDLVGPFCMSNGYRFVFTAIDPYTKFVVAKPIRSKDAKTVAKVIVENILLIWGASFEFLSDRGSEFENELSEALYDLLGIRKVRSSGYRPQTCGTIESWHRVLNTLLAKIVSIDQKDWSSYIGYVVFCYNCTTHSATGFSPYFLMTGRHPLWNVDLLLGDSKDHDCTVPQYVQDVRERLATASDLVRENLQKAATTMASWYNRKVHPKEFQPGDKVRLYCPRRFKGRSPKLQSNYLQTGEVLEKLNDCTYRIKTPKGVKIFHTDKLKLM